MMTTLIMQHPQTQTTFDWKTVAQVGSLEATSLQTAAVWLQQAITHELPSIY